MVLAQCFKMFFLPLITPCFNDLFLPAHVATFDPKHFKKKTSAKTQWADGKVEF